MRRFIIVFFVLLSSFTISFAQKTNGVGHASFQQSGNDIYITFGLNIHAKSILLYISTDGGSSFRLIKNGLNGHLYDLQPGRHTIIYDVLSDVNELHGNNICFKVEAVSDVVKKEKKQEQTADNNNSFNSIEINTGYDMEKYSVYLSLGYSVNPEIRKWGFSFHLNGYHGIQKVARQGFYYGDVSYDYEHGNDYGSYFFPVGFGVDLALIYRASRILYINPSLEYSHLSLRADRKSELNLFGGESTMSRSNAISIGTQLGLRWKHFGVFLKPEYVVNISQSSELKTIVDKGMPELNYCKGFGCKVGLVLGL